MDNSGVDQYSGQNGLYHTHSIPLRSPSLYEEAPSSLSANTLFGTGLVRLLPMHHAGLTCLVVRSHWDDEDRVQLPSKETIAREVGEPTGKLTYFTFL